ncbi:MAG TPA: glutamate formimidoyltransferase, partial [Balneolales bacterium]|nr:glutamate formimidoyltransferase [Balneolales bacterium]
MQLVECVPNFSTGRDPAVIDQIVGAIESVKGVRLLDVDPGEAMNRTVVTFVGTPKIVEEAAFQGIRRASELIDMRQHQGSHPRMGATDVCPFVPVHDVTLDDCDVIARTVGKRVGETLQIPVFLYEHSARTPARKNLANIRRGEYEGMEEKLKNPDWQPDFGPSEFNPRSGCTAIGAREFLIAYNINLNTREALYATDIAFDLRKKGRSVRTGNTEPFYFKGEIKRHTEEKYFCGSCDFTAPTIDEVASHTAADHQYDLTWLLKEHEHDREDLEGNAVKRPGMFDEVKAIGWFVSEYDCAQISINLTNYKVTPPHEVYEAAKKAAEARGLSVTGSEVVGLIPYQALMDAGIFYLKRQSRSPGIPAPDILETAVQSLGLRDKTPFDISEKVIGQPMVPEDALVKLRSDAFVQEVSRESMAPGGGSVSAYLGALGAALASMVSNLSVG